MSTNRKRLFREIEEADINDECSDKLQSKKAKLADDIDTTDTNSNKPDHISKKRQQNVKTKDRENIEEENKLPSVKLLFLDVDGVLNRVGITSMTEELESIMAKRLKQIIETTNCKIVLSSSWRLNKEDKLDLFLRLRDEADISIYNDLNVKGNIYIGDTPDLWDICNYNGKGNEKSIRTMEILYFLDKIKTKYNVSHWVVLDDLELGVIVDVEDEYKIKKFDGFEDHFVHTVDVQGLTETKMSEVVTILNKE